MRPDLIARIIATGKPYVLYTDVIEDGALEQFAECMEQPSVIRGALMPDTHKGYVAPIGSVLLTKDTIYSSFVGYDIGCGMSSITIDNIKTADITQAQLATIRDQILRDIPIGFNHHSQPQQAVRALFNVPMTDFARRVLDDTGCYQLGTLGGGNHFLELGTTNNGSLAIVIHSGSRGVGHKIATHYMKEAAIVNTDKELYKNMFHSKQRKWLSHAVATGPETNGKSVSDYNIACNKYVKTETDKATKNIEGAYPLDVNSQLGKDYINDMNMALEFALANRQQMLDKCLYAIERTLNVKPSTSRFVNRNHNHAELTSEGWVHRKGATQAHLDMLGVIPGNMVDGSFIVKGLGNSDSMNSSSHGAGRVLSRRKAKETLSLADFKETTAHLVANHSDSNLDEAPLAYKNIFEVMGNQSDLVEVLDRVTPILNIKG